MKYLIGIQPTGKLHIGNYLGCLKKGLEYQEDDNEVIFLIANYHSLTTSGEDEITENELIRLGCDNIVRQTPEVLELFFKLCCQMNLGSLLKMPQYKDKKDSVQYDLGLLLYPVLMAADIIYHNPDVVLVGKDQVPHIELCNDICKRVGVTKTFQYELSKFDKIMSLVDPTKKMSKSLGDKHVLYLFDEDYNNKLRKAVTTDEGVENLLDIFDGLDITNAPSSNQELKELIAVEMSRRFI